MSTPYPSGSPRPRFLGRFLGREKPRLPPEVLGMTTEEYRRLLVEGGYSERAADKEVERFEEYQQRMSPRPAESGTAHPGPVMGELYRRWVRGRRRVREREEERPDGDEDE